MTVIILLTNIVLSVGAAHAHTGPGSDGGGKAVVCRNKGKIASAEILDLFEARNLYNLKAMPEVPSVTVDGIVSAAKKKLEHSVDQPEIELFPEIDKIPSLMHLVKPQAILNAVDDAGPVATPDKLKKNCKLEQLANYTSENDLFVNEEIWKELDNRNKAALILHEGIYKFERTYGAKDSRRSRKVVAYAMSTTDFEDVHAGIPEDAQLCVSDTDRFYLWPNSAGGTWVQYLVKGGQNVYSRTVALVPISLPWPPAGVNCGNSQETCGFTATAVVHSTFDNWEIVGFGTKPIDGKTTLVSVESDSPIQCRPGSH
jgi:hypothetical protein